MCPVCCTRTDAQTRFERVHGGNTTALPVSWFPLRSRHSSLASCPNSTGMDPAQAECAEYGKKICQARLQFRHDESQNKFHTPTFIHALLHTEVYSRQFFLWALCVHQQRLKPPRHGCIRANIWGSLSRGKFAEHPKA